MWSHLNPEIPDISDELWGQAGAPCHSTLAVNSVHIDVLYFHHVLVRPRDYTAVVIAL